MNQTLKTILVAGATAIVVSLVLLLVGNTTSMQLGGAGAGPTHFQDENFVQGLHGGTAGQFILKNTGAVSSSAVFSVSGATTFAGAITLSGAKTLSGATTTLSAVNLYTGTATSSGVVFQTDSTSICYLLHMLADGRLATSTASCN